jgi:hypothetical protein
MERSEILNWFEQHPGTLEEDRSEFVTRCERSIRRHAREQAWLSAKRYVEKRRRAHQGLAGAHASEVYVAREVCHQIADELERHEPEVRAIDADQLVGGPYRQAASDEAWEALIPWIVDVAQQEEHAAWLEIVRYTDRRARELIRDHHLSSDCDFDHSKCYWAVAERIERLLERDFAGHAFPH